MSACQVIQLTSRISGNKLISTAFGKEITKVGYEVNAYSIKRNTIQYTQTLHTVPVNLKTELHVKCLCFHSQTRFARFEPLMVY